MPVTGMATGSTLYRIQVDVSLIDEGIYQTLDVRVAQHSSEDLPRLVTRVLAYCLAYEEGLSFGAGLDDAKEPALALKNLTGDLTHWIDVGHPNAERIHRASKACPRVTIVCHKSAEGLVRERAKRAIHRVNEIAVWLIAPELVEAIGQHLERNSQWSVVLTGGDLMVTVGDDTSSGTLTRTTLAQL